MGFAVIVSAIFLPQNCPIILFIDRPWYLKKDIQEVSKELTKLNDNPVLLRQFIRESEKLKNIKLAV